MDLFIIYAIEIFHAIAILIIISLGLAVIFGMMKIVNMAHGEFMMIGGYVAIIATNKFGLSVWVSMLILAPLIVGLFGAVVERVVIRKLYGRIVESMLATWGLSLALIGAATMIFGNTTLGISSPLGGVKVGAYSTSGYALFIIAFSVFLISALWLLLKYTSLGLCARATMQDAKMASALGTHPGKVYSLTFGLGAALSGLSGALLAPVTGVIPSVGASFIAKAFITVISGGSSIIAGTLTSASLFGTTSQIVTFLSTPVLGSVALLIAAIILIRLLPDGITGRYFRRSL